MTLERGALLYKRYRIIEILGQGGMGSVYHAVDENLGVDCAVKENLFTTDEYARQFRLEAVILANIRHPNLPRVTDHFVIGDQGQYLVMDYIEGEDLRQRMERVGNITEDDAILIGAAICDALTYLHMNRKPPILHRDIKPGNVKITPDGEIFLVDFGLAKVLQANNQATTTGARAMTPGYSPPEQYGTARTDPRTDIYSLGATLYAALTGIIPEDGLARAMDNTQLTPLRKRNNKVSKRLASAIEKAMNVDPSERYQNAEEFKRALLGSKAKTQILPSNYKISPSPETSEEIKQSPIEKESQPAGVPQQESKNNTPIKKEVPVFKPKRRKRSGRRLFSSILIVLFLMAFTIVGAVRFRPDIMPTEVKNVMSPVSGISIPFLDTATITPAALISSTASTGAQVALVTHTSAAVTKTSPPTRTPVPSATPTIASTPTQENTSLPQTTPRGGGLGQIAFASNRSGIPQIYMSNVDGTNLVQLTNVESGACQPSWSPDGSQLVFISPCLNHVDSPRESYTDTSLFMVNADGTGLKQLTSVPGADFEPAWSPDGTQIAFTSIRDGNNQIYLFDVDTQKVTSLTKPDVNVENSEPAWSPDGTQIAYMVKRLGTYQVWIMSRDGKDQAQLVRSGQSLWDYGPAWSADGKVIVFNQRPSNNIQSRPWLMSIQVQGGGAANRLNFPTPIEDVKFSPDGLWLVSEGRDSQGNRDIYFMMITGGSRTRLTTDPAMDFDPAWRPAPVP
ncbi:MAG: protein kinase domain-containing protein [Bacteroidota bacterium]